MMTVELEPGGTLTEGPTQRFLYVLEGELTLKEPGRQEPHAMSAGGYAFLPTDYKYRFEASDEGPGCGDRQAVSSARASAR